MTIEELKAKANEIKIAKEKIKVKEEMIDVIISSIATGKNMLAVKDALTLIKESIDLKDDSNLVKAIEDQTNALKDGSNDKIINQFSKLIKQIKLLDDNSLDKGSFKEEINSSIDRVINLIVDQNQFPNQTKYTRNTKGKISSVLEIYNNFTLKSVWIYDKNNRLIDVKTTRNEA